MALQDKYRELVTAAQSAGVSNLQVREQDKVLYVDGVAPSEEIKQRLWDIYGKIDPDYRSADLVMNIKVIQGTGGAKEYVVVSGDNLSKIGKKFNVKKVNSSIHLDGLNYNVPKCFTQLQLLVFQYQRFSSIALRSNN